MMRKNKDRLEQFVILLEQLNKCVPVKINTFLNKLKEDIEDEDKRSCYTFLMLNLTSIPVFYNNLQDSLSKRFKDKSPIVRAETIATIKKLKHLFRSDQVVAEVQRRLLDQDERVRMESIKCVLETDDGFSAFSHATQSVG
eukprot:TRINITY_DN104664_c0_g1_i1.p1 TRINITY_DN104664_c0_g1~~TRINITY_DN104664_c0_g1_i1.p1  ORF type:complete len:161 (-),score=7.06 TRINITY_DN104664_c0_g1_i1:64-486(-)